MCTAAYACSRIATWGSGPFCTRLRGKISLNTSNIFHTKLTCGEIVLNLQPKKFFTLLGWDVKNSCSLWNLIGLELTIPLMPVDMIPFSAGNAMHR